jgi:hypothetical protein
MAFARNTCNSRSGDPDDHFETMALELKSRTILNNATWRNIRTLTMGAKQKTMTTTKEGAKEPASAANTTH